MIRDAFHAMGTGWEVVVDAPAGPAVDDALRAGRAEVARLERVFSRFRADSELSRLNAARRASVSADMARVLGMALAMGRRTGGWFDARVGRAVAAAGYDAAIAEVRGRGRTTVAPAGAATGAVFLDASAGAARLGDGVTLDLGGVAKGDAADRVAAIAGAAGPCLVSAGGDVVVGGAGRPDGWVVRLDADPPLDVAVHRGAVATSGTDRRRWPTDAGTFHHIIDPRTGRPARTDVLRAGVVAATCAEADALATAMVAAGRERAGDMAARLGVTALLVGTDGTRTTIGGWR